MTDFTKENAKFWSNFTPVKSEKKLLIEQPTRSFTLNVNGILSVIINQARGYQPYWVVNKQRTHADLIKSYFPAAQFIIAQQNSISAKVVIFSVSVIKYLQALVSNNVLAITHDQVRYGDAIYDTYLKKFNVATIHKVDLKLLMIIYNFISHHVKFKKIILNNSIDAVLSSSYLLTRVALRCGCAVYIRDGHENLTLQLAHTMPEIYNYPFKPTGEEIDHLLSIDPDKFNSLYNSALAQYAGDDSVYFSAQDAYSSDKMVYVDRKSFDLDYQLDSNKKNVFIMLHAFNDYPHSHFKWMLFRDYYDWLIETLRFAESHTAVNWIFKQHPSIRYYRTIDVDFNQLFASKPSHIRYIDEKDQINTKSLLTCADLIVTCLGSAGFEMPAMGGIPALIAGDTFYNELGFTLEPKTIDEYFSILQNSQNINRLTPEQQKKAQAAFIYICLLTKVPLSSCPVLSMEQQKDTSGGDWYWNSVLKLYETKSQEIYREVKEYSDIIAKDDFRKLTCTHRYL